MISFLKRNSFTNNTNRTTQPPLPPPGLYDSQSEVCSARLISTCSVTWGGGGGGWEVLNKVYQGRLRPEVKPLTLLYSIFDGKGTPFLY